MLKIFLRVIIFTGSFLFSLPVLAQHGLEAAPRDLTKNSDIPTIIGGLLNPVLGLVGTAFFVLVIYGGLLWMTSAGNEETTAKAKKILIAAVIGLIIIMSAYAITQFVGSAL